MLYVVMFLVIVILVLAHTLGSEFKESKKQLSKISELKIMNRSLNEANKHLKANLDAVYKEFACMQNNYIKMKNNYERLQRKQLEETQTVKTLKPTTVNH